MIWIGRVLIRQPFDSTISDLAEVAFHDSANCRPEKDGKNNVTKAICDFTYKLHCKENHIKEKV